MGHRDHEHASFGMGNETAQMTASGQTRTAVPVPLMSLLAFSKSQHCTVWTRSHMNRFCGGKPQREAQRFQRVRSIQIKGSSVRFPSRRINLQVSMQSGPRNQIMQYAKAPWRKPWGFFASTGQGIPSRITSAALKTEGLSNGIFDRTCRDRSFDHALRLSTLVPGG